MSVYQSCGTILEIFSAIVFEKAFQRDLIYIKDYVSKCIVLEMIGLHLFEINVCESP